MAPEIWEAIEGLHPYRILAIGNPLAPEGNFYNAFQSPLWHKITISCKECVDWQDENGKISGLVTQQWIDERLDEWGEKSPLYQARVLGEFPVEGTSTLIPLKYIERARLKESEEEEDAIKIVSSDVATKHGESHTVMGYRVGHTMLEMDSWQNLPSVMTAQNIQHKYEIKRADTIVIDSSGFGEGIADILQHKRLGVLEFKGSVLSGTISLFALHRMTFLLYCHSLQLLLRGLLQHTHFTSIKEVIESAANHRERESITSPD